MEEDANTFEFQQQQLWEVLYQSSFADAATQINVSDFNVSEHKNTICELNETVKKPFYTN